MTSVVVALGLHSALLLVVMAAGALLGSQADGGGELRVISSAMVAAGIDAYGTGLIWYWSPHVGVWVSRLVPVVAALYVFWVWQRHRSRAKSALRAIAVPFSLTVLWSAISLGVGFLFGGYDQIDVAENRFSWRLPVDNLLPYMFGRYVEFNGHQGGIPAVGEWLSSDRPPLQSAFWLTHTLWHESDSAAVLHYQVLATLLQSLWVFGVWALVVALRVRPAVRALTIAGCAACGQVLVNSFYAWPKLLAAAYVLVATALVLGKKGNRGVVRLGLAAVAGALAYLAHGGAVFPLLPVAAVGAWQACRSSDRVRSIPVALLSAGSLLAPWALYQRYVDPPGDRLLKWMLADVQQVDSRGVLAAIIDRYREVGLGGALRNKAENLLLVAGLPPGEFRSDGDTAVAGIIGTLRGLWFYALIPTFGLLMVLALGWFWWRRMHRRELSASLTVAGLSAVGVLGWCLLMFGPRTTMTHQGSYAFVLFGIVALVCAGAALTVRGTLVIVVLQAAVMLSVYVPLMPVADAAWTSSPQIAKRSAVLFFFAVVAFVGLLVVYARSTRTRTSEIGSEMEAVS